MPGIKFFPALVLCLSTAAQAQVYTWVDEKGQKHFGSQPPAPEQAVETVDIRQGYSSDGQQPKVADTQSDSSQAAPAATRTEEKTPSSKKMCSEAMRWTAIDIPNLKEIAGEPKKAGKITADQHKQAIKGLEEARKHLTMQNCLASKGEDRERFECLSQGAGIVICSGALEAALRNL